MPFLNAVAHWTAQGNPPLLEIDILSYTLLVYSSVSFSSSHIPVSYHSTFDYTRTGNIQMSLPTGFSVFLLDRFENGMLYSMPFLPLCFDVLTDYFYRCATRCQQTKALTPECFFPKLFPYLRIFFFQQPATCTFICIDKFT